MKIPITMISVQYLLNINVTMVVEFHREVGEIQCLAFYVYHLLEMKKICRYKSLRIVHNTETKMIKQIRQQEIARICNHEDI